MAHHDPTDDRISDAPRAAWGVDPPWADAPLRYEVFGTPTDAPAHLLVIGQPTTGKSPLSWSLRLRAGGDDALRMEDGDQEP